MEARNITIINSRTQNRVVISSTAETLAELKADCRDNNINFDGLTFFEGISKSELKDDNAILPKDLPWKGSRTNDLVFMLTEPQKKIRNGATVTDRKSAYDYIKANSLQAEVQKKFGDNFTRCKTPDLVAFCNKHAGKAAPKAVSKAASAKAVKEAKPAAHKAVRRATQSKAEVAMPTETTAAPEEPKTQSSMTLTMLVDLLVGKGVITAEEAATGVPTAPQPADINDSDIKSMFRGIK